MVTTTGVFFDEHGQFIEGYYLVGLLAEGFSREPGARMFMTRADLEYARYRPRP